MNFKNVPQEKLDAVVSKFQKYGVGIVMAPYVNQDSSNATLWHELVYPNRGSGSYVFDILDLEKKYRFAKSKAIEYSDDIYDDDEDLELDNKSIFLKKRVNYNEVIEFTWEELTLFLKAVLKERKKAEKFNEQALAAKRAFENRKKNLTPTQRAKMDEAAYENFVKEYGDAALTFLGEKEVDEVREVLGKSSIKESPKEEE